MRFGFVTAVRLGLDCIEEIYEAGGSLDLLVTLRDDTDPHKSGRVRLDELASHRDIDLVKVSHINDDAAVAAVAAHDLDWLFIIGWSQIASPAVLAAPRSGAIGMHPTLLPRGRGRAPIPWAIIKGLDETGVTMFKLDEGVDTGPIIARHPIPIDARETAATLYAKVGAAHRALIRDHFASIAAGTMRLEPQDESQATVWPGRRPADGRIEPTMSVAEVDRLVRATTRPYPGAFLISEDGSATTIWAGVPGDRGEGTMRIHLADGVFTATETEPRPG